MWGELVIVKLTRFRAGEYPWTRQDFYCASEYSVYAAPTVDPIVIDDRVAESNEWWDDGYLWSAYPLPLDDNYKLTKDVTRLFFIPIGKPSKEKDNHCTLIEYEIDGAGHRDVFEDHIKTIIDMLKDVDGEYIEVVTLWECDAGKEPDTWMGPGEYYSNYSPVGFLIPYADRIELRKI